MLAECGRLLVPYQWIGDFVRATRIKIWQRTLADRPGTCDVDAVRTAARIAGRCAQGRGWNCCGAGLRSASPAAAARLREETTRRRDHVAQMEGGAGAGARRIPSASASSASCAIGLLTDARSGEKTLQRMIDRCAHARASLTAKLPEMAAAGARVPKQEIPNWLTRRGSRARSARRVLCPGAVGPGKSWPEKRYADWPTVQERRCERRWSAAGEKGDHPRNIADGKYARDPPGDEPARRDSRHRRGKPWFSNRFRALNVAAGIETPVVGLFGPRALHDGPLNRSPPSSKRVARAEGDFGAHHGGHPVEQVLAAVRKALSARDLLDCRRHLGHELAARPCSRRSRSGPRPWAGEAGSDRDENRRPAARRARRPD